MRIVEQHKRAVSDELKAALASFRDPIAGSPRERDVKWAAGGTDQRRKFLHELSEMGLAEVIELWRVADEHAAGLDVLLRHKESLPIPMLSLCRSIQEALLEVCWALDPAIEPAARTARWAALWLRTVQGSVAPLSQIPNGADKLAEVRDAMSKAHALLAGEHFDLRFDNAGISVTSLAYEGSDRAAVKINITGAATTYMSGSEHMWSLGSGATHSRTWFTGGLEGPADLFYIMIATPLLDFTDAALDCTHGLLGLPTAEFHNRAHVRRIALLQRRPDYDRLRPQAGYREYAAARANPDPNTEGADVEI